jgi:hypothetical protein
MLASLTLTTDYLISRPIMGILYILNCKKDLLTVNYGFRIKLD